MKKTIALFVALLGLLLAAYYSVGFIIERNLKQKLEAIDDTNKYKIKVEHYKRGLFRSQAVFNIEIISPAKVIDLDGKRIFKPSNTYSTSMPLVIYHGPVIFKRMSVPMFGLGYADGNVTIPGHYIKNFENKYTKDSRCPELGLKIFINYAVNTSVDIVSPKFQLVSNKNDSSFAWQSMISHVDVSKSLDAMNGYVHIKDLSWMQDKILTVLKEVNSYFKLYKGKFDLYLGDSSLHIPSALVTNYNGTLIELKNLNLKSNSFINENLFNSSLQATLDKIYINKQTYSNCSLDLYIRNLDADTLMAVNNKIKRLQNDTDKQRKQVMLSILPDLPSLVNKGAEIEISDFNFDMGDGNVRANFILSLANDNNKNPFYLIQKARGNGHLQISKSLLLSLLKDIYAKSEVQDNNGLVKVDDKNKETKPEDLATINANNKISELLNRGFIIASSKYYVADIKIVQGRIIINDKPFSMDIFRF